ncbi:hypothetical protein [Ruegeria arenilitoris]|uniref:hypothetical protein n=1 Tax=Ruegeria arenilitoris TaxID=1173585 RepID=UPI00147D10E6|nr:hypothetical protein [Ruegeria arenilitoris]
MLSLDNWSLDLGNVFIVADESDRIVSLEKNDGTGSITLSVYYKDSPVTEEDLIEFLQDFAGQKIGHDQVSNGSVKGVCAAYTSDHSFWRVWFFRSGNSMLVASYNCSEEQRGVDDELIDELFSTLERSA